MMARVYHHTNAWFEPGEQIQPGNWGRVVRGTGGRHDWFMKEAVFELIRSQEFATKPSRLQSSFVYKNEGFASSRLDAQRRHLLYEVRPADPGSSLHEADLHWIDVALPNSHDPGEVAEIARQYWTGSVHTPESVEIVVAGPLRVVRLVRSLF